MLENVMLLLLFCVYNANVFGMLPFWTHLIYLHI